MTLDSPDDLRTVYRSASGGAVEKVVELLDDHCRDFLAKSPIFILSSANHEGVCDGSPKGGAPGFVEMLDDHHVAWADYSGNNRLDSFENIVRNDSVALLFLIPGLDETLRINGRASLSTDADLCERFAVNGTHAKVVVVVAVDEAYVHCAKAFRRSGLWSPDTWLGTDEIPNAAAIVKDHAAIEATADQIAAARADDLDKTLWHPGGN